MKKLYVVGAGSVGGHIITNKALYGLESTEIILLDDNVSKKDTIFMGVKIRGEVSQVLEIESELSVFIGIAFPEIKGKVVEKLKAKKNVYYPSLIAKNAWISKNVKIGRGVLVYPNSSINYNTIIDDFAILNMNCAIGHDCSIGKFSSLAPSVSLGGNTTIGPNCEMGIGSCTRQGISIGRSSKIGGQTMVVNNINNNSLVLGVPGKTV